MYEKVLKNELQLISIKVVFFQLFKQKKYIQCFFLLMDGDAFDDSVKRDDLEYKIKDAIERVADVNAKETACKTKHK